jgi:hypothetical protein
MAAITGAVIGAASVANAAYQGSKNRQAAKDANAANQLPGYVQDANAFAVQRTTEYANRAYTPYNAQRVAGLSNNERTADNLALSAVTDNQAGRNLERAGQMTDEVAASDWTTETAQRYMNPFTDLVTNQALKKQKEAYGQDLAGLQSRSASAGAFGGDRATMLESNLKKDYLEKSGDLAARSNYDAYNNASQMWQSDNNRRLAAANSYRAVGGDISRLNSAQITDLIKTGQTGRLLEQAQLDINYQDFIDNRDWDVTNIQPLLNTLSRIRTSNGAAAQPVPASNGAGQVLGALATVAGYFGQQQNTPQEVQITGAAANRMYAGTDLGTMDTPTNLPAGGSAMNA